MLKLIFWSLLCINAALFAYGRGYLGNFKGDEREPARLKDQVNHDKLKLQSPPGTPLKAAAAPAAARPLAAASAAGVPAAEPTPVAEAAELVACTLIGNFTTAEARKFEAAIAPLSLGTRLSRENVSVPEVTSHIVFIPPQPSKEAADRKAEELKGLGVTNFFIMNDSSPMKWGISLGVFKSETAAQTLLAALIKQGVSSAKVAARTSPATRAAFRLRDIDPETKARLDAVAARFPQQDARSCK